MAVVSVSFDGNRVNASDANTNWGNEPTGGPAPAAEPQLRYQGANAVNKKITSTASRTGIKYDPTTGAENMTLATRRFWFIKAYIADFGDLNTTFGCEIRLGSANNAYHSYNVAGSGAKRSIFSTYPAQGGYIVMALDPNIAGWRDTTTGVPDLAAVDYFAFLAQFVTGGAKSENLALDAIDIGTGLTLVGGDGADADGTFADFVSADQVATGNRWGVVQSKAGAIICVGVLTIGTATATEFVDTTSVVIVPDGYHSAGRTGVKCDIQNASTIIRIGATIIGRGTITTEDTRPDFTVSGTAGTFEFFGTLRNHRNVTFTSVSNVHDAVIGCRLLTQNSADIKTSLIRTLADANVATLQDPTFGTTTDLRDTEFEQAGSGHAIMITTPDTYGLNGLLFSGYGGTPGSNPTPNSGASDAAIYNNSGGAVTLNITDGDTPSVRNGAGATTTVTNTVTITFTGMKDNTEVRVYDSGTGVEIAGTENATDGTPDNRSFSWSDEVGNQVDYVIHSVAYETIRVNGFTVPSTSGSIPIQQRFDRNFSNP